MEQEYYIDPKINWFIKNKILPSLQKEDKDYLILVDGYEGSGKSTFVAQLGKAVDPSLELSRICMTADEFKEAIINAKKGQCVIYDEAVTGLSAADSITRIGRLLKSLMMQMRQKNLLVVVILPSLFEMNRYAVLSRARFFFHIYESSGRRGYWVGYNQRDTRKLYLGGKKSYSYILRSRFKGRFYGKFPVDKEGYLKKKEEALMKLDELDKSKKDNLKHKLIFNMITKEKISQTEAAKRLTEWGIPISQSAISQIMLGKVGNQVV